nr:AAA family ATPase [Clostridia bacterium]
MRIIKCHIEGFGRFSGCDFDFTEGLNVICRENGAGKTTLTAFIKAMLYGLGDNRRSVEENERRKYKPWQGGAFGGSMTVAVGERSYVIERSFGAKQSDDSFTLRNALTGAVSPDYTENIGLELFGIDKEGFIRTILFSERTIEADDRANDTVASRLSDVMGADGDIGSYSGAIKLLDERRKRYQKRGGQGEIARIKGEILDYNRRLDELSRLSARAEEKERELTELEGEIRALEDRERELRRRHEQQIARRERMALLERYRDMCEKRDAELEKVKALLDFFGGNVPTLEEVDEARDAAKDAARLRAEAIGEGADEVYLSLSEKYSTTSQREIERIVQRATELDSDRDRLRKIEQGEDERSLRMRELFPARLPTEDEIETAILKAKGKPSAASTALIILGAAAAVSGAALGALVKPPLFSICALGVVLSLVGVILRTAGIGRDKKAARAFLGEILPSATGDALGHLYERKNSLSLYNALSEERAREEVLLRDRISSSEREISAFLEGMGITGGSSTDIGRIREEYNEYLSLSRTQQRGAQDRLGKIKRSEELQARAKRFLDRFPTVTDTPFDEIRANINEYGYRSQNAGRMCSECEKFAAENDISLGVTELGESEEQTLREERALVASQVAEMKRQYTITEQEYRSLIEECDTEEEVAAARLAATETLAEYERSLNIIKLTKELLTLAAENMSSRYIGKTRERFIHYASLISGEEGEYFVDTDFTVKKNERGEARAETSFSRGTRDLFSLAMRLALVDSLYEGELPFLILDDPFISLDDRRRKRAMELISAIAKERQIIYLTCSEARAV